MWKVLRKYRTYFLELFFDNFYQEVAHAWTVKTVGIAVHRSNVVAKMKKKRLFFTDLKNIYYA